MTVRRCWSEWPIAAPRLDRQIDMRLSGRFYDYESDRIGMIDPEDRRLRFIHERLKVRNLRYVLARFAKMQRWPKDRLPIVVILNGHWVLWDGHHRAFVARLRGCRLRARMITLR